MGKYLTTDIFIQRAIKLHGDRFDYSKVDYKKALSKVTITCRIHGDFEQPRNNYVGTRL